MQPSHPIAFRKDSLYETTHEHNDTGDNGDDDEDDGINFNPNNIVSNVKMSNSKLSESQITDYQIHQHKMSNSKLSESQITDYQIHQHEISNSKLSESQITDYQIHQHKMSNSKFSESQITDCQIHQHEIINSKLSESQISNEATNPSNPYIHTLSSSIYAWLLILTKALIVCGPVVSFLVLYFFPILVFEENLGDVATQLLYTHIRRVLTLFFFYGFIITYAIMGFGFDFCRRAIQYGALPSFLLGVFVRFYFDSQLVTDLIAPASIFACIFFIARHKLPLDAPLDLHQQYARNKASAKPVTKMVIVLFIITRIIHFLYTIFLESSYAGRMFIRFLILPLVTTLNQSIQLHFLHGVSLSHADATVPMFWISSGFLKIAERLFANTMFSSDDYLYFVASTFGATLIEMLNHATYFYRLTLVHRLMQKIDEFKSSRHKVVHNIPIAPMGENENIKAKDETLTYMEWIREFRRRQIIEDISIDLMMAFTVTLLVFVVHPLVVGDKYQMIRSPIVLMWQLLVQIGLSMMSDVFGIHWIVRRNDIPLQIHDIHIRNKWYWLWSFFMAWQALFLLLLFLEY